MKPDLVVDSLDYQPVEPSISDLITFSATVKNIGETTAETSILSFKIGGETNGAEFRVPSLQKGETYSVFRRIQLAAAQNYLVTVKTDIREEVNESSDGNNERVIKLKVK